jgi:hypothetical protein
VSAVACEIAGDRERVKEWLGGPVDTPVEGSDIQWVDGEEPGLVAVVFATPDGQTVRID